MSSLAPLSFQPSPFRQNSWFAEAPTVRYTVYQSLSGYVVHHQRISPDATEQTLAPERLCHFFTSFEDALAACDEHYRAMLQLPSTRR